MTSSMTHDIAYVTLLKSDLKFTLVPYCFLSWTSDSDVLKMYSFFFLPVDSDINFEVSLNYICHCSRPKLGKTFFILRHLLSHWKVVDNLTYLQKRKLEELLKKWFVYIFLCSFFYFSWYFVTVSLHSATACPFLRLMLSPAPVCPAGIKPQPEQGTSFRIKGEGTVHSNRCRVKTGSRFLSEC